MVKMVAARLFLSKKKNNVALALTKPPGADEA